MPACNRRSALRRSAIAAVCAAIACILHTTDADAARKARPVTAKPVATRKRVAKPKAPPTSPATAPAAATEPTVEPTPAPPPDLKSTEQKPAGPLPEPYEYRPGKDGKDTSSAESADDAPQKDAPTATTKDGQQKDAPADAPLVGSRVLKPLHLDAKLTGNSDVLLGFVGVGAAVDLGVARAGPGTIAVGAAGEYNFCASVCWALNAITPFEFGQRQISLWGRASYHIDLKGKIGQKNRPLPLRDGGPHVRELEHSVRQRRRRIPRFGHGDRVRRRRRRELLHRRTALRRRRSARPLRARHLSLRARVGLGTDDRGRQRDELEHDRRRHRARPRRPPSFE